MALLVGRIARHNAYVLYLCVQNGSRDGVLLCWCLALLLFLSPECCVVVGMRSKSGSGQRGLGAERRETQRASFFWRTEAGVAVVPRKGFVYEDSE